MKKDVLLWAGAGQIGWRLQDVSERILRFYFFAF